MEKLIGSVLKIALEEEEETLDDFPPFARETYTFKDLPKKRKYIADRVLSIYENVDLADIDALLDQVEIKFRVQKEKGASNHHTKKIFLTTREIDRNNMKNRQDMIDYLEDPKSIVTHEVTHMFQNTYNAFPHVQYTYEDKDGGEEINYEKYVSDPGELQARIEQVIELLKWGFQKPEIVQLLFSRLHEDPGLWMKLVDKAEEMMNKKLGSSQLPADDTKEKPGKGSVADRNWLTDQGTKGNNYENDYLSSGHLDYGDGVRNPWDNDTGTKKLKT